jgi:hypothetical protein
VSNAAQHGKTSWQACLRDAPLLEMQGPQISSTERLLLLYGTHMSSWWPDRHDACVGLRSAGVITMLFGSSSATLAEQLLAYYV